MIRAIICDLGNVLLHFDHRLITARLAKYIPEGSWGEKQESEFWPLLHAFERGAVDTDGFLAKVGRMLDLPQMIPAEEFTRMWADIFWPNQEFIDLLSKLKNRLTLVMLSNTNPLHIAFARERFPALFEIFAGTVFSFESGKSKPDAEIFREAIALTGANPEETIYFDDIAVYADAASALGMHGYQYISIEGASDVLRLHDVYPK